MRFKNSAIKKYTKFALQVSSGLLLLLFYNNCGEGFQSVPHDGSLSGSSVAPDPTPTPTPTPGGYFKLDDYLGALYNERSWSNNVRDMHRADIEMQNTIGAFIPLPQSTKQALTSIHAENDLVSQIGGMGSAKLDPNDTTGLSTPRFQDYMNSIIQDNGVEWKSRVHKRALEMASILNPNHSFHWQLGNEIAAKSYSSNVRRWQGETNHNGKGFDQEIIPIFIEYFFAPSAEAILQANQETGNKMRIALGSINGFANSAAEAFLDALLNYEIKGTFASSLAGTKVYEHVDLITVHYLMNGTDPANPEYWKARLNSVYNKWIATGHVKGIWSTEELGIQAANKGYGASTALRVASRYFKWIIENNFNRDQVKCFFYGDKAGPDNTTADDGLSFLYNFIEGKKIALLKSNLLNSNILETYSYGIDQSNKKFWIVLVNGATEVTELQLDAKDSAADGKVLLYKYGADGVSEYGGEVLNNKIIFDQAISILERESILVVK